MTDLKMAQEAAELTLHILEGMSITNNDSGIKLDEDNQQNIEILYGILDAEHINKLVNNLLRESLVARLSGNGETIILTPDNTQKLEDIYGHINKSKIVNNLIDKGWGGTN